MNLDDFISFTRKKAKSRNLLNQLEGRSDVRITPTYTDEYYLAGLPRRYKDILILLLVEDLIPANMKFDFLLWKEHLVTQRKWSLDQRILFRTFSPSRMIQNYHPREVYGNLVPRALKLLGNLKYHKVRQPKAIIPQRKRGYTDQGSAAPYDKKARQEAVYSRYETDNQRIAEDTDDLALLLGSSELSSIESHLGTRTHHIQDCDGELFSAGTEIPETRATRLEDLNVF